MEKEPEEHLPREEYLKHWNLLTDIKAHANDQYDKMVLPVAGGALFLSMAFLEKIVKNPPYVSPGWLLAGWCFLALAILASLFSLVASYYAANDRIKEWDEEYIAQKRITPKKKCWTRITSLCNIASMVSVGAGVICIIIFVYAQVTMEG